MKKYGLEQEFFVVDTKTLQPIEIPKGIPMDSCGWLAEARTEPCERVASVMALLDLETRKIGQALGDGQALVVTGWMKIPPKVRRACLRKYGKGQDDTCSLYGQEFEWKVGMAGLHIHFSNRQEGDKPQLNMPKMILQLDGVFRETLKHARRKPGLYEIKSYGFEYRSLPADVELGLVERALGGLEW